MGQVWFASIDSFLHGCIPDMRLICMRNLHATHVKTIAFIENEMTSKLFDAMLVLNICEHATFSSPDLKPSVCCACLLFHECHVIHVCCLSGRQHPVDIFAVLLWRRLERQVCIALNHNTRCHHEYHRHRKICKECRCKTIRAQKKPLCPVCRIQTFFNS